MKKRNFKKAFTLVELMVVVALGAIILTLSFVGANKARIKTRDKVRVADIDTIRLAIEEYKLHCGEYPNKIALNTNNGCHNGEKLGDYLRQIPVAPQHSNPNLTGINGSYKSSQISNNTYLYVGLSTIPGGRCYDYHIAAELEMNERNMQSRSSFLNQDHDVKKNFGKYNKICSGSNSDFSDDINNDDEAGLYDFRSTAAF